MTTYALVRKTDSTIAATYGQAAARIINPDTDIPLYFIMGRALKDARDFGDFVYGPVTVTGLDEFDPARQVMGAGVSTVGEDFLVTETFTPVNMTAAEIDQARGLDGGLRAHRDAVADDGMVYTIGGVDYVVKTTQGSLIDLMGASAMIDKAVAWAAGTESPIDPNTATRSWTLDRADASAMDVEVTLTLIEVQQMAFAVGERRDAAFAAWQTALAARQALLTAEDAEGILAFDIAAAADWPAPEA